MIRRKALTLAMALATGAAFVLAAGQVTAGETLDRVMDKGEMIVASSPQWPPHGFMDDDGNLVGFDIDVAKELGKRMGVKVTFDTPSFALVTGGHWHKRWDLASFSITPTDVRKRVLDFPVAYYYSTYVFVVHEDSPAQTRDDLRDTTFGVEGGTSSDDYLQHESNYDTSLVPEIEYLDFKPKKTVTYKGSLAPFDDLRLGDEVRIGAIVAEDVTAELAIEKGYPVRILDDGVAFVEPIALATDKGDVEFNEKIRSVIEDMRADGTLSKFSEKWFKSDVTKLPED